MSGAGTRPLPTGGEEKNPQSGFREPSLWSQGTLRPLWPRRPQESGPSQLWAPPASSRAFGAGKDLKRQPGPPGLTFPLAVFPLKEK